MPGPVEFIVENNNLPLLEKLEPLTKARLILVLHQIGLLLEKGAVLAIQNQVAPDGTTWTALQDWYVKWKRQQGFSDQIYIMSSSYIGAITSKVEEEELTVVAGVMKDGGTEPNSSEDIWKVAEVLEYGWEQFSVKIPPRPLWRPLLEKMRRSIETRFGIAIARSAKEIAAMAKGKVEGL